MPNSFGTSSQQFILFDPRHERSNRIQFRRDQIPELSRANSFYMAGGMYPSRGWILLRRSDYNQLNTYSISLQLSIDDLNGGARILKNLAIVQARCVSRGIAADPDAVYLVEITDARGVYWNQWVQFPTTSAFNIRAPAYPQTFYTPSLNSGSAWTWSDMVANLWAQMPLLGAFPGLPSVPSGTPEGWWFPGQSAWEALNRVLDYLGFAVAVDLTSATPYTIVSLGAADAAFTALQTKYAGQLEDDLEWIDTGSGRVPASVLVLFHRRNQYYGTEETVREDSLQWSMTPFYSVSAAAPAIFASAAGEHYVWSGFTVQYDVDGNPLAADVATAATVAAGEVSSYFQKIYRGTLGFMSQTYTGVLPFVTGAQVDGVVWRQDFRTALLGWQTSVVRGPQPPFPEIPSE